MKDFNVSVTAIFRRLVRDFMQEAPPAVFPTMSCGKALRIMRDFSTTNIIVTTPEKRPIGIITGQDVVRRITFLNTPNTPVGEVMTSPIKTIHDDDYLFHGIALMHKYNLDHLPVVDRTGHLAGILHLTDALTGAVDRVVDLVERLTHEDSPDGLKLVKEAEVEVVEGLLNDGIRSTEIQALLTRINNDIYRRVEAIILKELFEEGWGEPPVEHDIIVMGSGGRGESFLYPDQDNGFILKDYSDKQHSMVDTYFIELAERMTIMLDAVGISACRGYVMATNPGWRKTVTQWYVQINNWLERPSNISFRYVDIFFDFQHVSGEGKLAALLRNHVTHAIRKNHVFLREMQAAQQDHTVALTRFGKLNPDQNRPHKGKLNLKYQGILPLVEAVRLLSLREGVSETSTLKRIDALYTFGVLNKNEQDCLSDALHILTLLILRQQISDYRKGHEVTPYVSPDVLSRREKDNLIESLHAVSALRARVHSDFTGDVF